MYFHKLIWLAVENLLQRVLRTGFLVLTVAVGAGATMFLFSFYRGLDGAIRENLLKGLPEKQLRVEVGGVAESIMAGQLQSMLTMGSTQAEPSGITEEHLQTFSKLPGVKHPVEIIPRPLLPFMIRWMVDLDRLETSSLPGEMKLIKIGKVIPGIRRAMERGLGPTMFYGIDFTKAAKEFGRPVPLEEDEIPVFVSRTLLQGASDFSAVREKKLGKREKQLLSIAEALFFRDDAKGIPVVLRLFKGGQRKGVRARIVGFYSGAPFTGLSVPHEHIKTWHAWHNEGKAEPNPMVYNSVVLKTHDTEDMLAAADAITKIEGLTVSGRLVTARRLTNLKAILPPATLVIGIILFFLAAGGIVVGLSLSVVEQTKRIGILRAVGAKQLDVLFLFLCEALMVGVLGAALGFGLQFLAVDIANPILADAIPGVAKAEIGTLFLPSNAFNATVGAVSILVALLAGLVPAFHATLIRPSEVLKV